MRLWRAGISQLTPGLLSCPLGAECARIWGEGPGDTRSPLPCPLPLRAGGQTHVNCNLRPAEALGEIPFPYGHWSLWWACRAQPKYGVGQEERSWVPLGVPWALPSVCPLGTQSCSLAAHHPRTALSPLGTPAPEQTSCLPPAAGEGVGMPGDTWRKGCWSWVGRAEIPHPR